MQCDKGVAMHGSLILPHGLCLRRRAAPPSAGPFTRGLPGIHAAIDDSVFDLLFATVLSDEVTPSKKQSTPKAAEAVTEPAVSADEHKDEPVATEKTHHKRKKHKTAEEKAEAKAARKAAKKAAKKAAAAAAVATPPLVKPKAKSPVRATRRPRVVYTPRRARRVTRRRAATGSSRSG
jgi:hypothetical protein